MSKKFIPVAAPVLAGNEKQYVMDCLETTWISSNGKYIGQFEQAFAEFCGVQRAEACCNGTVALHLALLALDIGPGDEVLAPTLTFVATANAVTYCGARPVFVDSEPDTWNIDPALLEARITERTKAIMVVHIYGHPVDMDAIRAVADRHNLPIVEDAAEAHGAIYKGQRAGSLGDIATFSFYGNKTFTTGEGGMVTTDNQELGARVRLFKGQGMDLSRRYWFPVIGYNYRMTNIAAALGLAQLEQAEFHLQARKNVAAWYESRLKGIPGLEMQGCKTWAKPSHWMVSVVLGEQIAHRRDDVMAALHERGVDTRPIFYPMHILPPYAESATSDSFPVADRLAQRGFNLPTWAGLSETDIDYVCENLLDVIRS